MYLFFDQDPVVYERWKHIENNAAWQVLPCARKGMQNCWVSLSQEKIAVGIPRYRQVESIISGIELSSDLVEEPVAARYGWANWPTGNLVVVNVCPSQPSEPMNGPSPKDSATSGGQGI